MPNVLPIPSDDSLQDPSTIPIKDEEAREQARLVTALRRFWNDIPQMHRPIIFAVPNGGMRNAVVAMQLKTQGVLAGIPDLCILMEFGETLWIEMKAQHGHTSKPQDAIHAHMRELAHPVILAFSAEDALYKLRNYNECRTALRYSF